MGDEIPRQSKMPSIPPAARTWTGVSVGGGGLGVLLWIAAEMQSDVSAMRETTIDMAKTQIEMVSEMRSLTDRVSDNKADSDKLHDEAKAERKELRERLRALEARRRR